MIVLRRRLQTRRVHNLLMALDPSNSPQRPNVSSSLIMHHLFTSPPEKSSQGSSSEHTVWHSADLGQPMSHFTPSGHSMEGLFVRFINQSS